MNGYKQNKRHFQSITYLLSILSLFSLALAQPFFASAAFASMHRSLSVSSAIPTSKDVSGAPTDQVLARAGVSVVRLVFSYTSDGNPDVKCPGLGVLVKSLPPGGPNDWVLTDGTLVSQVTCASGTPAGALSQIQIFFSTAYNKKSQVVTLDSRSTPLVSAAIKCSASALAGCNNAPALISFQGDQVPTLETAQTASNSDRFIALTRDGVAGTLPLLPSDNPATFLTPQLFTQNSTDLEAGTPLIDTSGHLTGLHSASASPTLAISDISSLIKQQIPLPSSLLENTVNTNWNKGIDNYYQKNYAAAQTAFNNAANGNANFQGAKDFAAFAQKALNSNSSQQTSPGYPVFGIRIGLWEASVIALAVFAVLLLLTGAIVRSRVERRRVYEAELEDANRRAATVAQEIERMEASQRDWPEHNRISQQSTFPVQQQILQNKAVVRKLARNLLCPRCGELIDRDAKYCPNCRLALTSSESGPHSQSASSASSHTDLTTRVEFDTTDIKADINANQLTKQEGG